MLLSHRALEITEGLVPRSGRNRYHSLTPKIDPENAAGHGEFINRFIRACRGEGRAANEAVRAHLAVGENARFGTQG